MIKAVILLVILSVSYSELFAVETSEQAPDFTLPNLAGENHRLEEYRGKVVLINFWASWCGPCRQEMPILDRIHSRYKPLGFSVLGVNVEENDSKARDILKRLDLRFPLLFDRSQLVSSEYAVEAMPFSVLVDRDGQIDYVHHGYKPGDENIYLDRIKTLLRR